MSNMLLANFLRGVNPGAFRQGVRNQQNSESFSEQRDPTGNRITGRSRTVSSGTQYGLDPKSEALVAVSPLLYRANVFEHVFPFVQSAFQRFADGGFGDFDSRQLRLNPVGGTTSEPPPPAARFIYTPQQVQQQVNAARAMAERQQNARWRQTEGEMAARGFGTRSPLAMALRQGGQTAAAAEAADQEREIRMKAAAQNAQQELSAGALNQETWKALNQFDIMRRRNQLEAALGTQRNVLGLIQALTSML